MTRCTEHGELAQAAASLIALHHPALVSAWPWDRAEDTPGGRDELADLHHARILLTAEIDRLEYGNEDAGNAKAQGILDHLTTTYVEPIAALEPTPLLLRLEPEWSAVQPAPAFGPAAAKAFAELQPLDHVLVRGLALCDGQPKDAIQSYEPLPACQACLSARDLLDPEPDERVCTCGHPDCGAC